MLESLPPTKPKRLRDVFPTASDDALDLLKSLLHFNPNKRLTAEQALRHPYVSQFHNPDDEPICTKKINIPIDDNQKFSIREYRNKLYADIHKRKKELRKKILQSHHNYYYNNGGGKYKWETKIEWTIERDNFNKSVTRTIHVMQQVQNHWLGCSSHSSLSLFYLF